MIAAEAEVELVGETMLETELADYGFLSNKPTINEVPVEGDLTLEELGIQPAGDYALLGDIPKNVSAFENDAGYLTEFTEVDPQFNASPSAKITEEDIESWNNKSEFSGDYNDLQNIPEAPFIPGKVSELENDKGFITKDEADLDNYYDKNETDSLLSNKANITDIPNISGLITESDVDKKIEAIDFTEIDPTVPMHVKNITEEDINKWNNPVSAGGTNDYRDLEHKPILNGVILTGALTCEDLDIQRAGSYASRYEIPTNVSQLANDSRYIPGEGILGIVVLSQADYDALETKSDATLYIIPG